jgi:hypothetical protein
MSRIASRDVYLLSYLSTRPWLSRFLLILFGLYGRLVPAIKAWYHYQCKELVMNTQSTNTSDNRRRTAAYRHRLDSQGVKRVEVRIPARDVPLVHSIAGVLRSGGDEAATLREQMQLATGDDAAATGKDLVAFFRNSPLASVGLNPERDKSSSRTVSFE